MNKEDLTDHFEYVDGDVKMTAFLQNTDWHEYGLFQTTDDPRWNIYNSDGHNHLFGVEWLFYTLGKERWKAKVHAQYIKPEQPGSVATIVIWFEHCNVNTGKCHDDKDIVAGGKIDFYDWHGQKWQAQTPGVQTFPSRPQFRLTKL